ncbi:MAG: hypothetical protein CM15mP102_06360 [Flavobacteriales bacterium]|nr:MAG: hypothetical protein CM15mP102_06360 [Flavobacteriales bacterium]
MRCSGVTSRIEYERFWSRHIYALRQSSIDSKRQSFINASSNDFNVGNFDEIIPNSDLVINLTPDKNHTPVVEQLMPIMKKIQYYRTLTDSIL